MASFRKFKITHFDREDVKEFEITLNQLMGIDKPEHFDGTEMQFSLQERLDEVLDLREWDRMVFQEDRSDKNSLSIIIRIQ